MNAGSAYIIKKVLRDKWGEKPCLHQNIERVTDLALVHREYFCLDCGREVTEERQ